MERDLEEAPAHPGDGNELHPHHDVSDPQRRRRVADQEGQRVERPADEGGDPSQGAPDPRAASPAQLTIIG